MTRGTILGVAVVLAAASLARPAPLPPPKGGADTPEGRFARQLALPPLGLFEPRSGRVKAPAVSKDDLRLYPEPAGPPTYPTALDDAHRLLWATSPAPPPRSLGKPVDALRTKLKQVPSPLLLRVTAAEEAARRPALERRLKDASVQLARAIARLETAADLLQQVSTADEPRRVQAWHTYLTAALLARAVYLDEHQAALGRMRREAPGLRPGHTAWVLRPADRLSDAASRRKHKAAAKLWRQLIKEHPGTVWESLAREALKAPLGVAWASVP